MRNKGKNVGLLEPRFWEEGPYGGRTLNPEKGVLPAGAGISSWRRRMQSGDFWVCWKMGPTVAAEVTSAGSSKTGRSKPFPPPPALPSPVSVSSRPRIAGPQLAKQKFVHSSRALRCRGLQELVFR